MDRNNFDRDNPPSGRPLHTYTPRSHEDLLRSHLQLDATRNARLQNELQRLSDENRRLRRDLDDAQNDIKDKENKIDDLNKKLRQRPTTASERSPMREDPNKVFELDGKPVTLDQILNHFDGVIKKHHDLLNKKNQQIQDLEDALRNKPKQVFKDMRNAETQSPKDDQKENDFAKELALIRKEYEQVEHLLSDRNNKLEKMIDDLQRKLDQYADEIERLRKELQARGMGPNESTMVLLKEKEKENDYLKYLINNLQTQPQPAIFPDTTNEDLENEIKRIIEDKKNVVKKLSNMIVEMKKTPSGNVVENPDMKDVEKECKAMEEHLNNMNVKLNNVLKMLKETPQPAQGEPVNKDDMLSNLNNLKKQCEDEIEALRNQLKSPTETPMILTGQARVRIDDPEFLKRKYPDKDLPDEPVNVPSNVKFYLYPPQGAQVQQQPSKPWMQEPNKPYEPVRYQDPRYQEPTYRDPSPVSSLKSYRPVTPPEVSHRYLPRTYPEIQREKKERLYPELPSETQSLSPKPRPHSPVSCEACQEDYLPPRVTYILPEEELPRSQQPAHDKPVKKKKKGCCGGKGSETSNVPYKKQSEEMKQPKENNQSEEEKIVYIHHPEHPQHREPRPKIHEEHTYPSRTKSQTNSPKPKRKIISQLKPERNR